MFKLIRLKRSFLLSSFNKCCAWNGLETDDLVYSHEPQREKTYLLTCLPSEDSNHPAYLRNMISLLCPHEKNFASLAIQNTPREDSDQTERICPKVF